MWYTRKGDGGSSGLFGTGGRLPKDSLVYHALGTLDELNSLLGYCRATAAKEFAGDIDIAGELESVQQCLFIIQAEIAGSEKKVQQDQVAAIEATIARIEALVGEIRSFLVPGATQLSGLLDFARAVSRRAERTVVTIAEERHVSDPARSYLNRLSSLLYALARYAASRGQAQESAPRY